MERHKKTKRKPLKNCIVKPDEKKFEQLTECSKVSKFSKKEFEDEINAKVAESVSERERKMAREMLADKKPIDKISRYTGLSEEDIRKL